MQTLRILLLLAVFSLLQGCRTTIRSVGEGILYPERPNFILKGKLDPSQLNIDTGRVYVRQVQHRHTSKVRYQYLRFWPDGRCFWGTGAYVKLDRDAVESLRVGNPGYFIIDGDSITMENFSPEYSGSYAVSQGKLIRDADGNINIRILETRYIGGFSLSLVRTYRYPNFGSQVRIYSDFYPVDFGPLRAMPTWGGDLDVESFSDSDVEEEDSE